MNSRQHRFGRSESTCRRRRHLAKMNLTSVRCELPHTIFHEGVNSRSVRFNMFAVRFTSFILFPFPIVRSQPIPLFECLFLRSDDVIFHYWQTRESCSSTEICVGRVAVVAAWKINGVPHQYLMNQMDAEQSRRRRTHVATAVPSKTCFELGRIKWRMGRHSRTYF